MAVIARSAPIRVIVASTTDTHGSQSSRVAPRTDRAALVAGNARSVLRVAVTTADAPSLR